MKKRELALAVLVYNIERIISFADLLLNLLFFVPAGVSNNFFAAVQLEIASHA